MISLVNNRNNLDPFTNLAIEDYLLKYSDKTFLFIYINSPSVVIGRNQNLYEEVNLKFALKNSIRIVRRISGGGAVYHDKGNLSYSLISRYDPKFYNNYKEFSAPAINTLRKLYLDAKLNDRNDVIIGNKKISGNAQFTSRKRMITHGTLLFNADLSALRNSLDVDQSEYISKSTKSNRSSVTNIFEELNEKITLENFRNLLIKEFSSVYGGLETYEFSDSDWEKIKNSSETRFKSWEWVYERNPKFKINRERIIKEKKYQLSLSVNKGIIEEIQINSENESLHEIENRLLGKKYSYNQIEKLGLPQISGLLF